MNIESGNAVRMSWNRIPITTRTGEKRVVNATNIPLNDQNLMISTVLDVTPEFKQETEIRRITANQTALINGTQDAIWSVDTELCLITANFSFVEMIKRITGKDVKTGDSALVKNLEKNN